MKFPRSLQKELALMEKGINFHFLIPKACRLFSIKQRIIKYLFLSDCNENRTYNHLVRKRTLNQFRPVWLNGCVLIYELSGCGFDSRCSHLKVRYRALFEQ